MRPAVTTCFHQQLSGLAHMGLISSSRADTTRRAHVAVYRTACWQGEADGAVPIALYAARAALNWRAIPVLVRSKTTIKLHMGLQPYWNIGISRPPCSVRCAGRQDQVHSRERHQDARGAGRLQNPHLGSLPEHKSMQVCLVTFVPRPPQCHVPKAAGQPHLMGASPSLCARPRGVADVSPTILGSCLGCTHVHAHRPRLSPRKLTWPLCRDAICSLILGSPPGKVYSKLRSTCARLNDS